MRNLIVCTTEPHLPEWVVERAGQLGISFRTLERSGEPVEHEEDRNAQPTSLDRESVKRQLREVRPTGYLMNGPPDYGPFFDAELATCSPDLQLVTYNGDSFDPDQYAAFLDIPGLRNLGITVSTTPGAKRSVAEGTIALLLSLNLGLPGLNRERKQGVRRSAGTRVGLDGRTLGVVGLGQIGTRVAEIGVELGMSIVYTARSRKISQETRLNATFMELPDLFAEADYVTIHLPAAINRGVIDTAVLSAANGLTLVNTTSDASIVEPNALLAALEDGRVRKVGIEGRYPEPFDRKLSGFGDDRVLLLPPYTSWDTVQTEQLGWESYLETLRAFVSGEPIPNQLHPRE